MCDLNMSGKVWTYTPEHHKTQHFGRGRVIFIGPKAQKLLKPFLRTDLLAYAFSPAIADRERRDRQHAQRVTPLSCGNVPGSNVRPHPKKKPGEQFHVNGYNRAIAKACLRAFPAPKDLDADARKAWNREHKWNSHQLRHSFATRVRREHGLDTVQVLLGHAQANVTQVYAEADAMKASAAILRLG
jgi:integrase